MEENTTLTASLAFVISLKSEKIKDKDVIFKEPTADFIHIAYWRAKITCDTFFSNRLGMFVLILSGFHSVIPVEVCDNIFWSLCFHKQKTQHFCWAFKFFLLCNFYCSLKVIGILNGTFTALPLCLPGVILGSFLMIRKASASKFLSGPRILIFPMLPSF